MQRKLDSKFVADLQGIFIRDEFNVVSLVYVYSFDKILIYFSDRHYTNVNTNDLSTIEIISKIAEKIRAKNNALPAGTGQDAKKINSSKE